MKEFGKNNMKKLVQINSVCNGSTGKIMCDIAKSANENNYQTYCFYGRGKPNQKLNCIKIGSSFSIYFHLLIARFGFNGHGSYFATKRLIKKLKKIKPDIIHLHNIHGYYINLKVLFNYLKYSYNGKIIWTLHDCWSFTGHCSYFTMANCNKWIHGCNNCPQVSCYPKEFFDTSKSEYAFKKKVFSGINNLTLVTPSKWLKELVEKSFLNCYDVKVVNNGIDTSVFKPTFDDSIYDKYNIPRNKKIILGVANIWDKRKGFDIFIKLSKIIEQNMIIVLVGLNKKQSKNLPKNIIGIDIINNQNELASLYTIADVFVNPSLEETFSLVTVEAMACNTCVVVCDTSAPKELIRNIDILVNHDVNEYYHAIKMVINSNVDCNKSFFKYQKKYMIDGYMKLY